MSCRAVLLFLTLAIGLAACAGSSPTVKVLGVTDTRISSTQRDNLLVFVEIVNPTRREMTLSRLEYRLDAGSLLKADGEISLAQVLGPESAVVIEVPVHLPRSLQRLQRTRPVHRGSPDGSVDYSLSGRLFAVSERIQRSWSVQVEGTLSRDAVADARSGPRVYMRIAGSPEQSE
ncbi:MAG: LEA type 2 family protein [Proteobacteria bacterium]|nr:LEA type 2 family protein [Pseudomonadota bacterium]